MYRHHLTGLGRTFRGGHAQAVSADPQNNLWFVNRTSNDESGDHQGPINKGSFVEVSPRSLKPIYHKYFRFGRNYMGDNLAFAGKYGVFNLSRIMGRNHTSNQYHRHMLVFYHSNELNRHGSQWREIEGLAFDHKGYMYMLLGSPGQLMRSRISFRDDISMKLTQKKLQKIMDRYYENADNIRVQSIDTGDLKGQAFIITAPYIDTMKSNITLTLYYDNKDKDYLLSDDGYSVGSVLPNGFKNNAHFKAYLKSSVEFHKVTFNPKSQAIQVAFTDVKKVTEAYHHLVQTIVDFLGAFSYSHMQGTKQSIPSITGNYWQTLSNNLDSHPEEVDKSLFDSVKAGRDNAISILDDTEKLIKMRATAAYVRSLREQVRTANEILASISHNRYVPRRFEVNAKKIAMRLDNDVTKYSK
ncbi:MAG: Hypothetical protein AJITA_00650 [Acetilactobacillus jinshanensis]